MADHGVGEYFHAALPQSKAGAAQGEQPVEGLIVMTRTTFAALVSSFGFNHMACTTAV